MADSKTSQYPNPDFSSLVMSIASACIVSMGLDPKKPNEKNLNLARYNIDFLNLLIKKTKNNLTTDELDLLNSCVKDLQMQFVNVSSAKDQK